MPARLVGYPTKVQNPISGLLGIPKLSEVDRLDPYLGTPIPVFIRMDIVLLVYGLRVFTEDLECPPVLGHFLPLVPSDCSEYQQGFYHRATVQRTTVVRW